MSQHNIIGSEAFEGKRYIMVHQVRSNVRRRRRRNSLVILVVAVIALIVGALVAAFALAPLLMHPQAQAITPAIAEQAEDAQSLLRMQPVERREAAATATAPANTTAN